MSNTRWKYKFNIENEALMLSKEANISLLLAKILVSRDICTADKVKQLLLSSKEICYDPFLMKDMDLAADRIIKAINNKESIVIYGDYDADGITSTSVLFNFLKRMGVNAGFYIPERITEGYGMSVSSVKHILEQGTELIITVDCGITAFEEANLIKSSNKSLIITDHHQCQGDLPCADAVVNPNRSDCGYPFKSLAGVGVVYKLVQALCIKMNLGEVFNDYIDLVGLGTVADVVPIIDENRAILSRGIEKFSKSDNVGLKALIEEMGQGGNKNIQMFNITPRINAGGRIGDSKKAVELFITEDRETARECAVKIDEYNKLRQTVENESLQKVYEKILIDHDIVEHNILVISCEGLHLGVLGIVAAKVSEKYNKPVFILTNDEDDNGRTILKGSARSIAGVNIFNALMKCSDILESFGGHELAAGISIYPDNLNNFKECINKYADNLPKDNFVKVVLADVEISPEDISVLNIDSLKMLEPYGSSNEVPKLVMRNIMIKEAKAIGSDKSHLKMTVLKDNKKFDVIGFNKAAMLKDIDTADKYDIMFSLENNTWNSITRPQMKMIELRRAESSDIINRDDLVILYKLLKNNTDRLNINNIAEMLKIDTEKAEKALSIFNELGMLEVVGSTYRLNYPEGKRFDLMDSDTYKKMVYTQQSRDKVTG